MSTYIQAPLFRPPTSYEEAVQLMAQWHGEEQDPRVVIFAFDDPDEQVVRLLEVSEAFPTMNEVWAIAFGESPDFRYKSRFIIVTPEEWESIRRGELALPTDWRSLKWRQVWPR